MNAQEECIDVSLISKNKQSGPGNFPDSLLADINFLLQPAILLV